ncbi:hypothetical protein TNCV_1193121 [Trichonephila clavipes]|nr:hypothetical protein TNCV_1193121 [Trichonephila clavipes]
MSLPTRNHIHSRWSPISQCELSPTSVKTGIDRRTCELSIFPKTAWPSRSPDLTLCDFWLWGFLKDNAYRERAQGPFRNLHATHLPNRRGGDDIGFFYSDYPSQREQAVVKDWYLL